MRGVVVDFATEMGIRAVSIQQKNKSLETIFREKTS